MLLVLSIRAVGAAPSPQRLKLLGSRGSSSDRRRSGHRQGLWQVGGLLKPRGANRAPLAAANVRVCALGLRAPDIDALGHPAELAWREFKYRRAAEGRRSLVCTCSSPPRRSTCRVRCKAPRHLVCTSPATTFWASGEDQERSDSGRAQPITRSLCCPTSRQMAENCCPICHYSFDDHGHLPRAPPPCGHTCCHVSRVRA